MRKAFINTLIQQARHDKNIWLLVADVGYGLVESFRDEFPDRFINVGIAEQNMIGVASGLALSGKKVFCYSLANFPTLRCLEQIRNDVCYHNLPVTIVSGGAGLYYGALGYSHHATEDIAVMRALPNMSVLTPCDAVESSLSVKYALKKQIPCYIRLAGLSGAILRKRPVIGKATILQRISYPNIVLASCGDIIYEVLKASDIVSKELSIYHYRPYIISFNTVKPIDEDMIWKIIFAKHYITIEEHNICGGFSSAFAEVISGATHEKIGIQDRFCHEVGSRDYLRKVNGLDAESIANKIIEVLRV